MTNSVQIITMNYHSLKNKRLSFSLIRALLTPNRHEDSVNQSVVVVKQTCKTERSARIG